MVICRVIGVKRQITIQINLTKVIINFKTRHDRTFKHQLKRYDHGLCFSRQSYYHSRIVNYDSRVVELAVQF